MEEEEENRQREVEEAERRWAELEQWQRERVEEGKRRSLKSNDGWQRNGWRSSWQRGGRQP